MEKRMCFGAQIRVSVAHHTGFFHHTLINTLRWRLACHAGPTGCSGDSSGCQPRGLFPSSWRGELRTPVVKIAGHLAAIRSATALALYGCACLGGSQLAGPYRMYLSEARLVTEARVYKYFSTTDRKRCDVQTPFPVDRQEVPVDPRLGDESNP